MASNNVQFVESLNQSDPIFNRKSGNILNWTSTTMSMLKNLSGQRLILHTDACREPHWQTNANKIIYYCFVSFQILIYFNLQKQDVLFLIVWYSFGNHPGQKSTVINGRYQLCMV